MCGFEPEPKKKRSGSSGRGVDGVAPCGVAACGVWRDADRIGSDRIEIA